MKQLLKIAAIPLLCACFVAAQTPSTAQQPAATNPQPGTQDVKKPILEFANANSAKIAWASADNQSENLGMHYGTTPSSLTGAVDAIENTSGKGHRASLVNLQPNTTYYVQMTTSTGQAVGPLYKFKTPAQGQPAIHEQPLEQ